MSTVKQKMVGGYSKKRQAKETDTQRRQRLAAGVGDALFEHCPFLLDDIMDDENPVVELKLMFTKHGTPMAIAKRSTLDGLVTEAFGTGDDLIEALIGLEISIASKGYRDAKVWDKETGKYVKKK